MTPFQVTYSEFMMAALAIMSIIADNSLMIFIPFSARINAVVSSSILACQTIALQLLVLI